MKAQKPTTSSLHNGGISLGAEDSISYKTEYL
jgi:hypothetical protein